MTILHLTHTDINSDSRILKEMQSVANRFDQYKVCGIGVIIEEEEHKSQYQDNLDIQSITLTTRKWNFLPKIIRHLCSLIELTLKMLLKSFKLKPTIIHCHDTLVLPLGILLKIFTTSKLIYDAHELESDRNGLTLILSKMTLLVEKILWQYIDRLIVVSPSILNWYQKNIGSKASEIILNSPVLSDDLIEYDKRYLRKKFLIPDNSKIFLYIGILGEGRGIDLLLETFKTNNLSAHIVFLGYGAKKQQIVDLSKQFSNIHLHNAVPHSEVVAIAKSADIGVCLIENVSLSDYYCLPNKLFEYAFAELPVLASNFPDISTTVKKYKLGKCSNLDTESIYQAIKEFELMAENLVVNSLDLIDLSWSAQEKKLIRLYEDLIDMKLDR